MLFDRVLDWYQGCPIEMMNYVINVVIVSNNNNNNNNEKDYDNNRCTLPVNQTMI